MSSHSPLASVLLGSLFCATALLGQQPMQPDAPASAAASRRIYLDVVVTPKSGKPVAGLQQGDFTIVDNKAERPITTFAAFTGDQAPIDIVLLIDAVNTDFTNLSYEREQVDKFLRANDGHLAHPMSLAIFTDTSTQFQPEYTTDGNALSASLDQSEIGLREIRRSAGVYGAEDKFNLSLTALHALVTKLVAQPGRKIVLWVSPGWPYLSGTRIDLDSKQQRQIFSDVTNTSTMLRQGNITIYSVDPHGSGSGVAYESYYEEFLKGVTKPEQTQLGNLALQVLAVQSGGFALSASNDISGQLDRCIADLQAFYRLSFDPPPSEHPDEYHQLQIKLAKPGLTARTRTGYYSEP
mgnify:CR=1 FL=1